MQRDAHSFKHCMLEMTDMVGVNECTICLDIFDNPADVRTLPCGHVFHHKCFVCWHVEQQEQGEVPTCSICRQFYLLPEEEETLWQLYVGTRNEMIRFLQINHTISPKSTDFITQFTPPFTVDERQEEFVAQLLYTDMTLRRRIYQVSYHFQPGWVCMPLKTSSERWGSSSPEPNRDPFDIPDDHWSRQPPHADIEWWDGCIFTSTTPEEDNSSDSNSVVELDDEDTNDYGHTLHIIWQNPTNHFLSLIDEIRSSLGRVTVLMQDLVTREAWTSSHRAAFSLLLNDVHEANRLMRRVVEVNLRRSTTEERRSSTM